MTEEIESIEPMESKNLAELYGALAKAQLEMEAAKEDSNNPFFKSKYADLASVVKASRPFLAKHGLCVIQRAYQKGEKMILSTRLAHASGGFIDSFMPITPPKSDIQSLGSYMTYLRRYTYSALVGVVTDEDDDGESSMNRTKPSVKVEPAKADPSAPVKYASEEIVRAIEECLSQIEDGAKVRANILKSHCQKHRTDKIKAIEHLLFDDAVNVLNSLKNTYFRGT